MSDAMCKASFDFYGNDPALWCDLPRGHDGDWHVERHVGRWTLDHETFQWWEWDGPNFVLGRGHWGTNEPGPVPTTGSTGQEFEVSAKAIVELGEPTYSEHIGQHQSVIVRCSEGDYSAFSGGKVGRDWSHAIDDHLAQHGPGRALDIEVDWTPSAMCSVCEDGIGDVRRSDDEGLACRECGTTWTIDGTSGERPDHTDGDER